MEVKKYFLILVFAMVSVIALLYGVDPQWFGRFFLDMSKVDLNIAHILRAVMCLYIALGCFWLYSAFSDKFRNMAVLTTVIFSGGLVAGRIISYFADGQAAPLLTFYLFAELGLFPVAIWVYRIKD